MTGDFDICSVVGPVLGFMVAAETVLLMLVVVLVMVVEMVI